LNALDQPIMAQLLEFGISIHMSYFRNGSLNASPLGDGLTVGSRSNGSDGWLHSCTEGLFCIAVVTTAMQTVLVCKRASKLSDPLNYDPTTDTTMIC
jgi:hypothetical protein